MKLDSNKRTKLTNYIFNDMSHEEILEIEKEISLDTDLAENYHLNMKVKNFLKAKIILEEMRSDPSLSEAEKLADIALSDNSLGSGIKTERTLKEQGYFKRNILYISMAAAVIVVLVIIRMFVPFTNSDRLFHAYFEPLDASSYIQRGVATDLLLNLSEGIKSYTKGEYAQSKQILSSLSASQGVHPEIQLYSGLSLMGLEQYTSARDIFKSYIENNTLYIPEAYWYLSLCYLKTGDIEESMAILNRMDLYDGLYKADSQSLLRKLRRIRR